MGRRKKGGKRKFLCKSKNGTETSLKDGEELPDEKCEL